MTDTTPLPCPSPWHDELDDAPMVTMHRGSGYAFVGCSCGINGPLKPTEAEALTAWNTRANADALANHLRELSKSCDLAVQERGSYCRCARRHHHSRACGRDREAAGGVAGDQWLSNGTQRPL